MNNEKGQVLVLFVILLPIILLALACVIDASYMFYQKSHLDNINRDILNSIKDKDKLSKEDISELVELNDSEIVNDNITINDSITIENHKMIDSIFGKLIGLNSYRINSKESIRYSINSNKLVLDIDSLNTYDNTNKYLINNYNVTYDDGLVFYSSNLMIQNFTLPENYKIHLSYKYIGDGSLISFNDWSITIENGMLHVGSNLTYNLNYNETYDIEIINKSVSINGKKMSIDYSPTVYEGVLYIGSISGKIDFIRIYDIGK